MELILMSSTIGATELHSYGGMSRIFPANEVRNAALASATKIASKSSPVVKLWKQAILNGETTTMLCFALDHEQWQG